MTSPWLLINNNDESLGHWSFCANAPVNKTWDPPPILPPLPRKKSTHPTSPCSVSSEQPCEVAAGLRPCRAQQGEEAMEDFIKNTVKAIPFLNWIQALS